MQNLEQLAQELRQARVAKGLTAEEAAAQTGVYYYTLLSLEAGKISVPLPTLLLPLAQCYGLDFPYLMRLAGHLQQGHN